jgi:hypothetical protein
MDDIRRAELAATIARAQAKADKTGITQYVGMTFTCKFYVSKVKPTPDWIYATCEPTVKG